MIAYCVACTQRSCRHQKSRPFGKIPGIRELILPFSLTPQKAPGASSVAPATAEAGPSATTTAPAVPESVIVAAGAIHGEEDAQVSDRDIPTTQEEQGEDAQVAAKGEAVGGVAPEQGGEGGEGEEEAPKAEPRKGAAAGRAGPEPKTEEERARSREREACDKLIAMRAEKQLLINGRYTGCWRDGLVCLPGGISTERNRSGRELCSGVH